MKEFLAHYIKPRQGNVLDVSGRIIGTHDGVQLYTYGERHGFTITQKTGEDHEPLYVIGRDRQNNTITVGTHDQYHKAGSQKTSYAIARVLFRQPIDQGKMYQAVIRYHGKRYDATIMDYDEHKNTATVVFADPDELIAEGQSIVVYQNDICIGGGIVA